MKRQVKKFVAFVLALTLCLQLAAMPETAVKAASADDFTIGYFGALNYSGTDEEVIVPVKDGVTEIEFYAYVDNKVKSITIPEGYTAVYLSGYDALEKLVLPESVVSLDINYCNGLKEINLPAGCKVVNFIDMGSLTDVNFAKDTAKDLDGYISINYCDSLKNLVVPAGITTVCVSDCSKFETLTENDAVTSVTLVNLPELKSANIPASVKYWYIAGAPLDGIKNYSDALDIEDGVLYDSTGAVCGIDINRETINVRKGANYVSYLNLSGYYYNVKSITLPDTIEEIASCAFEGAALLEKVNIPKNVLTIGSYAFSDTSIKELVIPKSVRFVYPDVFSGYRGTVKVASGNEYLVEYKGGIYKNYSYDTENYASTGEADYCLVYYPKDKTDITFSPYCHYIDTDVFVDSKVKKLALPEGLLFANFSLWNSQVTSLSIPGSVTYVYPATVVNAPELKKLTVALDNPYYASYKNCLYTKDMVSLIGAPHKLETVEIYKSCLSAGDGVLSNRVKAYDEDFIDTNLTVYFPKDFATLSYYSISDMYVYADSPMAELVKETNEFWKWAAKEYGWDTVNEQVYHLRDSNNDLLDMIYVVDAVSVKKGKKKTAQVIAPTGLNIVDKLTKNRNTEVQVKFTSSNKKIAKVNATTGVIKGVKKGKCKVTATCTITNGKKTTTKTFDIVVKVK